jgi:hypothetical protein
VLVAILPHYPKLEPELELIGSGRDADLSDDRVDALWPLVSVGSDSLVLQSSKLCGVVVVSIWQSFCFVKCDMPGQLKCRLFARSWKQPFPTIPSILILYEYLCMC